MIISSWDEKIKEERTKKLLEVLQKIVDEQPFLEPVELRMKDLPSIWKLAIKERMAIERACVIYVGEKLIEEGKL